MSTHSVFLTTVVQLILIVHFIEPTASTRSPRLLIISLDGFRHQYLKTYSFNTFNRIQNEGVKATNGMQPTFVSMTFPNHISIATGMYQEDHGIIHNRFWDTNLKKIITFDTGDEGQWPDAVEPIWITATKQNKRSAVLFWPAAHNSFHGIRPLIYSWVYSDHVSLREKIDNSVSFFRESVVDLVMLYHLEPDKQGHIYGPNANETYAELLRLDDNIDYLMKKVKSELNDDLNIIILSDHGMTDLKKIIRPFHDGYINRSAVEDNIIDGTIFSVTPRPGQFDYVFNGLRLIPDTTTYKRDEFPVHYHYAKAIYRVGEIITIPNEEGLYFSQSMTTANPSKGTHGYDNTLPSMQAIFMAHGPDFNQHTSIDSLKNVDVYHIACKILNIQPNSYATAGSINNITHIFRTTTNQSPQSSTNSLLTLILIFLLHVLPRFC